VADYRPMNKDNKAFLEYVLKMYEGQEIDPRFADTDRITIDLPGLPGFIVKKFVYSPDHVNVAMAWPRFIAERAKDKSFLEVGTGTGICAIYVALHGNPKNVVATDISPLAVTNCKENAKIYNLVKPYFDTREADVFSAVSENEKFDILFWNFPWNAQDDSIEDILVQHGLPVSKEKIWQLRAGLDQKYNGLKRFIAEGRDHLNPGGEILLGAGSPSRHDIIYGEAKRLGYKIEIASEQSMIIDKIGNQEAKVILYRLTR